MSSRSSSETSASPSCFSSSSIGARASATRSALADGYAVVRRIGLFGEAVVDPDGRHLFISSATPLSATDGSSYQPVDLTLAHGAEGVDPTPGERMKARVPEELVGVLARVRAGVSEDEPAVSAAFAPVAFEDLLRAGPNVGVRAHVPERSKLYSYFLHCKAQLAPGWPRWRVSGQFLMLSAGATPPD